MSVSKKVDHFIDSLREDGENLFPYLSNENYKKGNPIYYSGPYWDNREISVAITSLLDGKWLCAGEKVNKFEREFSQKFGFYHSLMVNSGSSANLVMIAALKDYFQWKDGDEILVCACGFPTTINPIIQNGLKPVFVDIDFEDLNWDLDDLKSKITERTVAAFSSPVLGNSYDFDKFLDIIDSSGIKYIADGCDSLGSKWGDEFITAHAIATSCSFYPAHHICTGEGGMVSSNIEEIVQLARSYAWWGRGCYCVGAQNKLSNGVCGKRFSRWIDGYDNDIDHKYVFGVKGYNLKPLDFQGAIGSVQIDKFEEIHEKRRSNKEKIGKVFESITGVRVIKELEKSETSWFGVPIVCQNGPVSTSKHKLVRHLEDAGIQTRNYFAGNILTHPAYKDFGDSSEYPNASRVLDEVFFVGCSPTITDDMISYIEEVVKDYSLSHIFHHPV